MSRWWALVAAALAVVVVGSVIVIKKKFDTETRTEAPDDTTGKGKTVGPGKSAPGTGTSADRKAAEWVISQGGLVRIDGAERDHKAVAALPKERFALTWVNLSNTKVSDAGLQHLKGWDSLEQLVLEDLPITDEGLKPLGGVKNLTWIFLQNTKVSAEGVKKLAKALPNCKIEWEDPNRYVATRLLSRGGFVVVVSNRSKRAAFERTQLAGLSQASSRSYQRARARGAVPGAAGFATAWSWLPETGVRFSR